MASQGRGAKSKGANYERAVAKKFTEWWISKGSKEEFHRTPGSGGLNWGNDNSVAGDIVPPQGLNFPFVVECKKQEGWTIDHVLLNSGKPKEWWAQVVTDARRVDRVPMLVFSRNRAKDFVMIPYEGFLYSYIAQEGNIMRVPVTIKNIRDEDQSFDVMVVVYDDLAKLDTDTMRTYASNVQEKWDNYREDYL